MHLVQLLLPVSNLKGDETAAATFREIDAELTEQFGAVEIYARSPVDPK